jgi:hypothetical protein
MTKMFHTLRKVELRWPVRPLALVLLLLCSAAFASAQSADKILKQATKAIGGEKAVKRITKWSGAGKVTRVRDGAVGDCVILAGQPNLYTFDMDFSGLEQRVVYNGRSSWTRDSRQGVSTLTGAASRDLQAETWYRNYRWLDYKKARAKAASSGRANIDGAAVNVVTLTTVKNVAIRLYFDERTGLLLRDEVPAGDKLRTTTYSDYRAVDGVMEPFRRRVAQNGDEYDVQFNGVLHNGSFTAGVFDYPKLSDEPLPDIPSLLAQVTANEEHIDEILENYGYTETTVERAFDDKGAMREKDSETHEWTFYKGNRIRRLIAKDGKPLSASEQASEDRRVEKEYRELEKKQAEKERKASSGKPEKEKQDVTISDILRASQLVNPRREVFRGRNVIVFDFEPKPGYKPQKDYEKLFGKTAGVIWVDDADRQVVRLEAQLVDSYNIGGGLLASLKKGSSFVFEQQRVNNEIWLPTSVEVNVAAKVLLFKSISANQVTTFSNYIRFNTAVEKSEVASPAVNPTPQP